MPILRFRALFRDGKICYLLLVACAPVALRFAGRGGGRGGVGDILFVFVHNHTSAGVVAGLCPVAFVNR